jgi:hypothetical protein
LFLNLFSRCIILFDFPNYFQRMNWCCSSDSESEEDEVVPISFALPPQPMVPALPVIPTLPQSLPSLPLLPPALPSNDVSKRAEKALSEKAARDEIDRAAREEIERAARHAADAKALLETKMAKVCFVSMWVM